MQAGGKRQLPSAHPLATGRKKKSGPERGRLLQRRAGRRFFFALLPFPRREACDLVDVDAIDADVVQLAIRIVRQFLDDGPVRPTGS
jgi:hypothetical protein